MCDRSGRFPGCTARRCDAHHVEHWIDGGATTLDNLVLLCRRHHRAVHEGGFEVRQHRDGTTTFLRPKPRVAKAAMAYEARRWYLRTRQMLITADGWGSNGVRLHLGVASPVLP